MDLDMYEYLRNSNSRNQQCRSGGNGSSAKNKNNRKKKKFHMSEGQRQLYLLSAGYSMNDIMEVCEQGRKIRKDRYNSFHGKKWDRFRVVMESAKSKLMPAPPITTNVVSAKTA